MIGKAVGMYVGFGWGLMASRHADKLIPIAELAMQAHPELAKAPSELKLQLALAGAVSVVEQAAARIALQRNIRIPYQDEGIVGVAIATATLGVYTEFKTPKPRNENEPAERPRDTSRDVQQPREAPRRAPAPAPAPVEEAELVDVDDPELQSVLVTQLRRQDDTQEVTRDR